MIRFLKNTLLFATIISLVLFVYTYFKYNALIPDPFQYLENPFRKKIIYFKKFIKDKDSVNLILGSSLIRDSLIPDSLGNNWFSFSNGGQNIYKSYKFLNYFKDSISIDTIVIGIEPFSFPFSYKKISDDGNMLPLNNFNFYVFGRDSINDIPLLNELQSFKNNTFPSLMSLKKGNIDVWSDQGFSGRINEPNLDLSSLHSIQKKHQRLSSMYFYNVNENPKMDYFDLFDELSQSLGIKLFYIITPKSKYYQIDMDIYNYNQVWNNILDSIRARNIQIFNFEKIKTDTLNSEWFRDDAHSSYAGAIAFTKIIRKRLKIN